MLNWMSNVSPTSAQVILIISNQADIPLLWKNTFQEKGFTAVLETHENALKTCRIIDPTLVIIDSHLSHTNRLDLCVELRAVVSGPILLLVPDYNSSQMVDIYNAGIEECLLKPISPAFLVVKALSWFLRRRWVDQDSSLSPVINHIR